MEKRKIAEKLAKFYLRYGRGSGLVGVFWEAGRNFIYLGLALDLAYRYLGLTLPLWVVAPLPVAVIAVYYTFGYLDEKFGFWKIQNSYLNRDLTPFFQEIEEKLNEIYLRINNKGEK